MNLEVILTQGPYSSFLERTTEMEGFAGLRLNTVMPVPRRRYSERLESMRRACRGKPLWIDLKARQLRVREFANTPYTAVTISHRVSCDLPSTVYFDNGRLTGRLVDIDGDRLIVENYAGRMIGPGESVNIPDSSLGFLDDELLTANDLEWIDVSRRLGNHHYMLSFVDSADDVHRLREEDPRAVVLAKVESRRGLEHLEEIARAADRVMAARGDLYVEVSPPHEVDAAVRRIVEAGGSGAVVGSRILESLLRDEVPSLADLSDLHRLRDLGVRTILIGDDICFEEPLLLRAVRIAQAVWSAHVPRCAVPSPGGTFDESFPEQGGPHGY